MSTKVADLEIGAQLICSRCKEWTALSKRMHRDRTRICDACNAAYKKAYGEAVRAAGRKPRQETEALPGERWRPIPGYLGYEASSLGRIRSLDRKDLKGRLAFGCILRPSTSKRGYLAVRIRADQEEKFKTRSVHLLVLLAFHGPRPPMHEGAHNDGNPSNNRPSNLRYATRQENEADKAIHGTKFAAQGEKNGQAKLSERDVQIIRSQLFEGATQAQLAIRFGVDQSAISNIARGKNWRHLRWCPPKDDGLSQATRQRRDKRQPWPDKDES